MRQLRYLWDLKNCLNKVKNRRLIFPKNDCNIHHMVIILLLCLLCNAKWEALCSVSKCFSVSSTYTSLVYAEICLCRICHKCPPVVVHMWFCVVSVHVLDFLLV